MSGVLQEKHTQEPGVRVQGERPVCGGRGAQEPVPGLPLPEMSGCQDEQRWSVDCFVFFLN